MTKPRQIHKNIGPFLAFTPEWFELNQKRLLWLLNSPLTRRWFKWVLRIRKDDLGYDKPIHRLLPNAYVVAGSKEGEFIADFRTHAKYGKRIYIAFRPMWWAIHAWDWLVADRFVPQWSYGFSVLTQYPGSIGVNNPVDGTVNTQRGGAGDTDWATLRSAAGSASDSTATNGAPVDIVTGSAANTVRTMVRGIFLFDTSSISALATISAAELDLYVTFYTNPFTSSGACVIDTVSPASDTALANSDFNIANWGGVAQSDTPVPSTTSAYNAFTLNATGRGNISKTGNSKFGVRFNGDLTNTAPTGNSGGFTEYAFNCDFSDKAGTTTDPKLVVTYSTNVTTTKTQTGKARIQKSVTQT
jgi:hypothetical protein